MFKYLVVGAIAAYASYQIFFADNRNERPPSPFQSHESARLPVRRRDEQQHRQPIDYSQKEHTPLEAYTPTRAAAKLEGELEARRYQQNQERQCNEQQHRQTIDSSQGVRHSTPLEADTSLWARGKQEGELKAQRYQQSQERQRSEQQHWLTIDSSQKEYTPLEAYTHTRAAAKQESDLKAQRYQQSQERQRNEQQHPPIINSFQRDDTPLQAYTSPRAAAKLEGDLKARQNQQSHEAYRCHGLEQENLNVKASALIFEENNRNNPPGKVDLHGLSVKEAIYYSDKAIKEACLRGDSEIRLIVGRGTHSDGGVSRLKPATRKHMQKRGFHAEVHPRNPGVLVVQLDSR